MIMFKTEMKEMPKSCVVCDFSDFYDYNNPFCKMRNMYTPRPQHCPLIEFITEEPKPIKTITQHERDLLFILQKIYPKYEYITLYEDTDLIDMAYIPDYPLRDYKKEIWEIMNLFDRQKLPTLLKELNQYKSKEMLFSVEALLSRPIKD